jgi:hypothetical protein
MRRIFTAGMGLVALSMVVMLRVTVTAVIALVFKAIVIPVTLHRIIAKLGIHREIEKVVGDRHRHARFLPASGPDCAPLIEHFQYQALSRFSAAGGRYPGPR